MINLLPWPRKNFGTKVDQNNISPNRLKMNENDQKLNKTKFENYHIQFDFKVNMNRKFK